MRPDRSITVTADAADVIRAAARVSGFTESQIVVRAIRMLGLDQPLEDPHTPVEVYCTYGGQTVTGTFIPATRLLTVTSGANAGQMFRTPSAAARAVIVGINPARTSTQANGWRFWHVTGTTDRLERFR